MEGGRRMKDGREEVCVWKRKRGRRRKRRKREAREKADLATGQTQGRDTGEREMC